MEELLYIMYMDEPWMRCIYKIWVSTIDRVERRVQEVQCWNPFKVKILKTFVIKSAWRYEYMLHTILRKFRLEWERFDLWAEMLDYVFRQMDIRRNIYTYSTKLSIIKWDRDINKIYNGKPIVNYVSVDTYEQDIQDLRKMNINENYIIDRIHKIEEKRDKSYDKHKKKEKKIYKKKNLYKYLIRNNRNLIVKCFWSETPAYSYMNKKLKMDLFIRWV